MKHTGLDFHLVHVCKPRVAQDYITSDTHLEAKWGQKRGMQENGEGIGFLAVHDAGPVLPLHLEVGMQDR